MQKHLLTSSCLFSIKETRQLSEIIVLTVMFWVGTPFYVVELKKVQSNTVLDSHLICYCMYNLILYGCGFIFLHIREKIFHIHLAESAGIIWTSIVTHICLEKRLKPWLYHPTQNSGRTWILITFDFHKK